MRLEGIPTQNLGIQKNYLEHKSTDNILLQGRAHKIAPLLSRALDHEVTPICPTVDPIVVARVGSTSRTRARLDMIMSVTPNRIFAPFVVYQSRIRSTHIAAITHTVNRRGNLSRSVLFSQGTHQVLGKYGNHLRTPKKSASIYSSCSAGWRSNQTLSTPLESMPTRSWSGSWASSGRRGRWTDFDKSLRSRRTPLKPVPSGVLVKI